MGEVGLSKYTPEALDKRARDCRVVANLIGNTLTAIRELDSQDVTLPAMKLAMRKEQRRLDQRAEDLERRRLGMLAD